MLQPHNITLQLRLVRLSKYLAAFVIVNGLLILLGWQFDIEILKHPLPVTLSTNPVSALAFILSGVSFLLYSSKRILPVCFITGNILTVLILTVALLKIIGVFSDIHIPVDELLFAEKIKITGTDKIAGMASNTAISFLLIAFSLLLLNRETHSKNKPAHYIALITALLSLVSIIGYINKVQKPFHINSDLIPLGIHSAICFFLLSLSILFAHPDKGLTKELTTKYTGSVTARLLLPVVIVIPVIIGFLRLVSHWNNLFPPEAGTTIVVFIIILIFLFFLWYNTVSLNKRDASKEEIAIGLKESEDQVQTIFRSAPDAVIVIDENSCIVNWNPKAEIVFGWKAVDVIGKSIKDTIIPHRYREAHQNGMEKFFKTGEGPVLNKAIEIKAINKDGKEFDISLSISPTRIKEKYVFIGFIRDISEKKHIEIKIAHLANLVDQSREAIISTDNNYIIKTWNRGAELLYGYENSETINQEGSSIIQPIITEEERSIIRNQLQEKGYWVGEMQHQTKKRDIVFVSISMTVTKNISGESTGLIVVSRDITELKMAEDSVRYNALLLHNISDAVISTDENLIIKSWNEAAEKVYGYTEKEAVGKRISLLRIKLADEDVEFRMGALKSTGYSKDEYSAFHKNGEEIAILASINVISSADKITGYVAIHHDITERKKLEKQLRKFNEELSIQVEIKAAEVKSVFERVSDAFLALDKNWCYIYVNKQLGQMVQRNPKSLIGKNIWEEFPDAVGSTTFESFNQAMLEQRYVYSTDYYPPLDLWQENHIYPSPDGLSVFIRNITGKKKTEEKLAESEKRFRALVENNEGIISLIDANLKILFRSASATRITGWTNDEYEKMTGKENIHPDDIEYMQGVITKALANPARPFALSLRVKHKKGHYIWLEGVINNMLHDPVLGGIILNLTDVTERVTAEEKIIKANRLYLFISQINQMIVRTTDQQTLFREACTIAVTLGKFRMVWIGMIDEETKKIIPVMHAGDDEDYPSAINKISVHEDQEGRGPIGSALREGKYTVCNDIENDPQMSFWKKEAIHRGYKSSMALPIKKFGKVVGVFSFYTSVKNFFDAEEILLLEEATCDVSFALEILEKEELRKQTEKEIIKSNERFEMIASATNDAVFELDLLTGQSWQNEIFLQLFSSGNSVNRIKPDAALWRTKLHPEDKERVIEKLEAAYAGTSSAWADEFRFQKADGSFGIFYDRAFIIRDESGKALRIIGSMTDITDLKRVEAQLKESEEKYRSLVEQAADAIFINDADGNLLDVNESACAMLGYTKEQLCNMNVTDLYTKEELTIRPLMRKELLSGVRTSLERNILHRKGFEIPVDITAKMLSDGRIVAIIRDISERKKAEQEIKKSNERFKLIGKAANDAVWEWNLETNIVWGNETHQQLFGLALTDPVPDDNEWKRRLHDEDRERIVKSVEIVLASEKNIWDGEYRLNTENKGWINVYGRTYIERNAAGKPIRMLGSMMDITERKKAELIIKESEEKYRTLIEQASDGIIIYSPKGIILDFNYSACAYMGYTAKEFKKLTIYDFFFKEDLLAQPLSLERLRTGQSVIDHRALKRKDGTPVQMEISTKVMPDGNLMAVARDITDRLKAEEKLQYAYQETRRLVSYLQNIREDERLKMSREIHDELGQQLTVMKMDISWLNEKFGKADDIAKKKTEALTNMLDETVKSVRRISSELRPSVLDDMGLAMAIEWHLGEFEKRFVVKTELIIPDEELIIPDSMKIGIFRIVQESLTNVARYAQAKKVLVSLQQQNNWLTLCIQDNGIGFDKEKIAVKKTLGILGMKERTMMMGGEYEIKSVPAKGTIVTVKIPLG